MSRQQGMSSLSLVLLLMLLGSLMLAGLNQQLDAFSRVAARESQSLQTQANVQSALEWGRRQPWSIHQGSQCRSEGAWRACLRLLSDNRVLLIASSGDGVLWQGGELVEGSVVLSPHGWSDFCPLREAALCQPR